MRTIKAPAKKCVPWRNGVEKAMPVSAALLGTAALVVMLLAIMGYAWFSSGRRAAHPAAARAAHVAATGGQPQRGMELLARAINAVNYDMRSVGLGRWYLKQLTKRGGACPAGVREPIAAAVAGMIPKANEVTRKEVAGHLVEFARHACETKAAGASFARVMQAYDELAFGEGGFLLTVPGYRARPAHALPP